MIFRHVPRLSGNSVNPNATGESILRHRQKSCSPVYANLRSATIQYPITGSAQSLNQLVKTPHAPNPSNIV